MKTISEGWYLAVEVLLKVAEDILVSNSPKNIYLMSISMISLPLLPDNNNSREATFIDNLSKSRLSHGCHDFNKSSTLSGSQVFTYLGKEGLLRKTPLNNLLIFGSHPIIEFPLRADMALLAQLIEL